MKKRFDSKKRQKIEKDEFLAYGEYSYDYLHRNASKEPPPPEDAPASAPPPPPPPQERERQVKQRLKRRKTHVFFKILGLLVVLTIGLILLQETVFRLETVYVIGNELRTPQQVVMASGLVKGRNIFTVNEAEIKRSMEQDHVLIYKGMQIDYPNTVYLYVEERHPVAVMQWLGTQYELDSQGMVMTENGNMILPEGMPLVTGFRVSNAHEGQQLMVRSEKQMQAYCSIMEELTLQMYADQISEINLSNADNIFLITNEGVTVRLGDGQYIRAKICAVRTDMAYLRQLGKTSGVLDVSIPEDAKFMPED